MTSSKQSVQRRLGNGLITTLIVLVMLGCAAWLLPSVLGYDRYVITGGSMSGSIEKGAVAFEEQVPVEDLRVGDVITYRPPASSGVTNLVTHRIVSIRELDGHTMMHTKGDANEAKDPWRFYLVGDTQPVVRFSVPHAGYVFIALAERWVRMLVIGLPAALIALLALRDLVLALRRRKETAEPVPTPVTIPAQLSRETEPSRTKV